MRAGSFNDKERKKRLAASKRAGTNWDELVGGGLGALGVGVVSGWNPALMAAGYQGGSALTDAFTGDDMKPEDVKEGISAGVSALGSIESQAAAKLDKKQKAEMSALIKQFIASQAK